MSQTIINQIPPHDAYLEPFLGSGVIFRTIRPALKSVGLDKDALAVEDFGIGHGVQWQLDGKLITAANLSKMLHGQAVGCGCALEFLRNYPWTGREFVYLDPPYLESTRRSGARIYRHEMMSDKAHRELLGVALGIPALVMISGYPSDLYASLLGEWRTLEYVGMTHRGPATECLWMNYPAPVKLHDYRFLGANFTDRQRLKRKAARLVAKLSALPLLEKQALLAALEANDFNGF